MFLRTIDRVQRLDEEGSLYYLEYNAPFYLLEKYVNYLAKPACSTFCAQTPEGEHLFARNYDYLHYKNNDRNSEITALNVVVKSKTIFAKYRSIAVCDGFWLDMAKGRMGTGSLDDGVTDISALALIPFLCMDGMNEKGLAVSIMHLPTENEWTPCEYPDLDALTPEQLRLVKRLTEPGATPKRLDSTIRSGVTMINEADHLAWSVNKNFAVHQTVKGRKTMFHPVLMRRMLDKCKNVEQAVKLARSVNIMSPLPDNDYHVMVADASGACVILEWINNELCVKELTHCTNFYKQREDGYGYGQDRDEIIAGHLDTCGGTMTEEEALRVLQEVSQDLRVKRFQGLTYWSSVYNLDKKTLRLWQNVDYDREYDFSLGGNK